MIDFRSKGTPEAIRRTPLYLRANKATDGLATELDFVSLPDALELVLLLVDDPKRFRRAARRWHVRYCAEVVDVGFEEALVVLACLARLGDRQPRAAAETLAALVHRRGFRQAGQALLRWAR